MSETGRRERVAIIGGGISGLAAAYFLAGTGLEVTVLEGSPRIGGKLAVSEVAGVPVDSGAEALLARRPEGTDLIKAAGLGDQLVYPGTTAARIWSRGEFRPLPRRHFMGVPADLADLERSEILSPAGLDRAREDEVLPATGRSGDIAAGEYIAARFGSEVVDGLVDPLLGGVYAGRADQLSFEATLPALAQAASGTRSLTEAAASLLPPPSAGASSQAPAPVFTTLAGGLGQLPPALAAAASSAGVTVRTAATVRELTRTAGGWELTAGPAIAPERIRAEAVILALPARPASRLLAAVRGAGPAAGALAQIEYASMAIVTLAYPVTAFPAPLAGSGYLVPAIDGRAVKAVTFSTVKWPHLRERLHVVRCSLGRIGEEAVLQCDDSELTALAASEFADATGVAGQPVATRVTRWGGALPQYTVGHLERVAAIRAGVAAQPGLAVCGAAYDGLGIPACIATARLAADQTLSYLARRAGGPAGRADAGE